MHTVAQSVVHIATRKTCQFVPGHPVPSCQLNMKWTGQSLLSCCPTLELLLLPVAELWSPSEATVGHRILPPSLVVPFSRIVYCQYTGYSQKSICREEDCPGCQAPNDASWACTQMMNVDSLHNMTDLSIHLTWQNQQKSYHFYLTRHTGKVDQRYAFRWIIGRGKYVLVCKACGN